jgi:adenylate cyclase, class 2
MRKAWPLEPIGHSESITRRISAMQLEVEQKHWLDDAAALTARLNGRGVTIGPALIQVDQYFAHPARDFAATDEALRIRTAGGKSYVTYKGPKLDKTTKTRRELELPLHDSDAGGTEFTKLLNALGFQPVASVRKSRRAFHIFYRDREVEGALDDVEGVGTFVELELLAHEHNVDSARETIASLASELDLGKSERRSYLELLLEG